ncbi:hypothetical protein K4L44_10325 [Halosquirtibacter laminarini]|uniref:Uncharacterized protein n=1 Tax=Halosquirtibacter laminarini TaxID=3374600 RepID=A0AC61NQT9_9BACT|nr:hypothetical protein K4L44_10325 [Prolixibacteraceae bacterium]
MKRYLLTIIATFTWVGVAFSQGFYQSNTYANVQKAQTTTDSRFEVTPMIGFQFGGKVDFVQGQLNIRDDMMYGGAVGVHLHPDGDAEFSYSRMDTRADFNSYGILKSGSYNLSVDYFQVGYLHYMKRGALRPFGLISVGATLLNSKDDKVSDTSLFSMALGGGVKYYLNDRVGLRLQGRLLMPMYFDGAGFMVGFGGGGSYSSIGVSATSVMVQGDFSLGLVFQL